ncbi:hypothetical protein BST61_g8693 [Cercospora zeina]
MHYALSPWQILTGTILAVWMTSVAVKRYRRRRPLPGIHVASLPGLSPQASWANNPMETVERALSLLPPDESFQVMTAGGPLILIRNKFAREVAQHPDLSLHEHIRQTFFPNYPGFEGVRIGLEGHIHEALRETLVRRMTEALGSLVEDQLEETTCAVEQAFGDSETWVVIDAGPACALIVRRIVSRVLLGKRLGTSKRWLKISEDYLTCTGYAMFWLSLLPRPIASVLHWLIPSCHSLRSLVREAAEVIEDEMRARDFEKAKGCDSITWLSDESQARGRRLEIADFVCLQLGSSVSANHSTSEALLQALLHICEYPEASGALRKEIVSVVGSRGWSKTSFNQLRLMDSFLSESQRHARGAAALRRIAVRNVTLSNDFTINQGWPVQVLLRNVDPEIYAEPASFKPARFLSNRGRPGEGNKWQYASASPEQMGFGLGRHSCPGRFFASHALKMILAELLLKYDWDFDPNYGPPKNMTFEGHVKPDSAVKIRCRRRKVEMD